MKRKEIKNHYIVPVTVFLVVAIYLGYVGLYYLDINIGFIENLKKISFQVFVVCILAMMFLIIMNKRKVDDFILKHPTIDNLHVI